MNDNLRKLNILLLKSYQLYLCFRHEL